MPPAPLRGKTGKIDSLHEEESAMDGDKELDRARIEEAFRVMGR